MHPATSLQASSDLPGGWSWFERQSATTKAEAERRRRIVQDVSDAVSGGAALSHAVAAVAQCWSVSPPSLWRWLATIKNKPACDWLPLLAPRRRGGGIEAGIEPQLWQMLKSDYLRPSRPSWESCYRRVADVAAAQGMTLPHQKTLWRRLEREVPSQVVTLKREGLDKLRRHLPPQTRSVADLHALELVNIDGHTCDVRVQWPDGRIIRPTLIAIQDVFSRKMLAWRIAESENAAAARLCYADLFEKWGIPKGVLSDNGRAFASKWLTGGAKTRHRFKIREEEPTGILTALGIQVHWALPYRGSSKPIERAFRDFCDDIAKHPAFEGAYTGNSPVNKPDNYGERSVDFATFQRVLDAGIHAHNRRAGRQTELGAGGASFDEVFDRSYATAPIGRATKEQLRMALLAADHVRAARDTGAVRVLDNSYWDADLTRIAGQMVTVRFDPQDATKPVHVYDGAGRFVATADMWERTGFLNVEAARRRARLEAADRRLTREAAEALDLLTADQLAAAYPLDEEGTAPPPPPVVRPVRHRGQVAAQLRSARPVPVDPDQGQFIDVFGAGVRRLRAVGE